MTAADAAAVKIVRKRRRNGRRSLRTQEDRLQRFVDLVDIDPGVVAGTEGTVVEDPDDGKRGTVLDAGGEIAPARPRPHELRPLLDDDLARERPAGGDGDVDAVLLRQLRQAFYVAAAAADTFVD